MMGCDCGDVLVASGDTSSSTKAKPKKTRKQRVHKPGAKFGEGDYCVYSSTAKKVRCFKSETSANNVARGFGRGFTVRKKHT